MKHYYKTSKLKNSKGEKVEYLQIWEGEAKGKGSLIKVVGNAKKLLKILVRAEELETMTKEYPKLMTKLNGEQNSEND